MRNWSRSVESRLTAQSSNLPPGQRLPWHSFVIHKYVFASRHVAPNGRDHLIFGHVFGDYTARYLPFGVDPLDDPAAATPWLLDGRGHSAAAHMKRRARQSLICVFQGVVLFPFRSYPGLSRYKDKKSTPPVGYTNLAVFYTTLLRDRSAQRPQRGHETLQASDRTRSIASSIRSTAITSSPSIGCFGAFAFGIRAIEKPSFAASFSRS